jgi:hypothetical protein
VLGQYDLASPTRWIVHRGTGGGGVTYSSDVDIASQLVARVAADLPLSGGDAAGPQAVGMALGFDFGSVPPGEQRTVAVTTAYQDTAPTTGVIEPPPSDAGPTPPPVSQAGLRLMSPVPFQTELLLEVALARAEDVRLDVFDLAGRRVRTLIRGTTPAGRTPSRWDGKLEGGGSAASGIYFLRLESVSWSLTRRIALVR